MKPLLFASLIALSSTQVFAMDSLYNLGWENRIVLVFGRADDQKLARQLEVLNRQTTELDERDMVVIAVTPNEAHAVYGKARGLDASKLKEDADIEGDSFHVVLVGKDGGIKLRSKQVVGDVEMFDLIDRMPMTRAGRG